MDGDAIAPGRMDAVSDGCNGDLGSRPPKHVYGCHRLGLLKAVCKRYNYSWGGHGAIRHRPGGHLTAIVEKHLVFWPAILKHLPMAGVGKLLKTAQKMQRSIDALQTQLEAREMEVTAGGGAVKVKINAAGRFMALALDPDFLKEDPKVVAEAILGAIQDAAKQAKDLNESEMQKVTSAFQMPGIF
jgi:nucleoid-associated protein EbfC